MPSKKINVVLVHGYGENAHVWDKVKPLLPKKYHYIIPDHTHIGVDHPEKTSIDDYARFINGELTKNKIKQAIIIGHSMGGYVTMAFAKKYPSKVIAIGLLHSHVFADSEEQKQNRRKAIQFLAENGTKKYFPDFVKNLFSDKTHKKIIEAHQKTIADISAASLSAALHAMIERPDTSSTLKSIKSPVLLMFGKEDKLMPLEKMLTQCEMPDRSMVEILKNSGHLGMLEETEKCGKGIREFLKWVHEE